MFKNKLLQTLAISLISTQTALAQSNGDWAKEGVDLLGSLEMGAGSLGITLVGVAILAFGLWALFTQKLEWEKVRTIFIAGGIITVGPVMLKTLFGL